MPEMGTVLAITTWFVLFAVVLNFVVLCLGLLAVVTGRSFTPPGWHRLRRHIPASKNDQRLTGMSLSLLAVGQLLMMVTLMVVITLATAQATGGHAPIVGLYLVVLVSFAAAVACTFASLLIGVRVRYANVLDDGEEGETAELVGTPLD